MSKRQTLNLAQRARAAVELTQREFASLIGTTQVTITRWETGAVEPKGLSEAVLRLVEALPEEVAEVLGEAKPEPQRRAWRVSGRGAQARGKAKASRKTTLKPGKARRKRKR